MDAIFLLIAVVAAFVTFDLAALRAGVDSRDGSTDPSSPAAGLS